MQQSEGGGVKQLMVQWLDLGILGPWIILLCLGGAALLVRQELARDFESAPRELLLSVAHPLEGDQNAGYLEQLNALGVQYIQCVAQKGAERSFAKRQYQVQAENGANSAKRSQVLPMTLCPKGLESLGSLQLKRMSDNQWALFSQKESTSVQNGWEQSWLASILEQMQTVQTSNVEGEKKAQTTEVKKNDPNIVIRMKSSPHLKEQ